MSRRAARPSRLRTADLLGETIAVIAARPARSALTAAGTLLAVAGFVAVLGLASSAAGQISSVFAGRLATAVTVRPARNPVDNAFPAGASDRVSALHGVLAAGLYWRLPVRATALAAQAGPAGSRPGGLGSGGPGSATPGSGGPGSGGPGSGGMSQRSAAHRRTGHTSAGHSSASDTGAGQRAAGHAYVHGYGGRDGAGHGSLRRGGAALGGGVPVFAVGPGFLAAAGAVAQQGRLPGHWDQARAVPVCLAGAAAARALGVTSVAGQATVMIGGLPCTVVGITGLANGQAWLLRSVLMPAAAAVAIWGCPQSAAGIAPAMLIRTRPGAAALVAAQAPLAISATDPARFGVSVPPSPVRLGGQVTAISADLFLALAAISLLLGMSAIAASTTASIRERTAEIGLRRAVGARRRHIVAHLLAESALLGLLGGLAGSGLGVVVVVGVAIARNWTPVIAPLTVLPAPLIGATAGLIAGLYPSLRAARMEPATALGSWAI